MDESQSDIPIEVNAPPSIELNVGNLVTNQPVTLVGETNQTSQNLFNLEDPQNVSFVMGPNGQLVAVAKPPFVWKHFWIGGGIPFALYAVPLLLMLIASGFEEEYIWDDVELVAEDNSTAYTGEITLDSDYRLEWCSVYIDTDDMEQSTHRYDCEAYGDQASIYDSYTGENVGYWNSQNGTIYLDAGIDHGDDRLNIQFESQEEEGFLMQIMYDAEGLMFFGCCLGLLLSLVFLIAGFSSGKPGMGWGGVTALVAWPVIVFIFAGLA